jgi:GNAT superfamily N-acetyltransferase
LNVTTWHLEMTDPARLRPGRVPAPDPLVMRVTEPFPELSRFLYLTVGRDWQWVDKAEWPLEKWRAYACRPELETWIAYVGGTPAGYFELEAQPEANVEIAYFGLLPVFLGRGLGGHLLTVAVRRAWEMNARRVWVHTCSLDAQPQALENYKARGFELFKTEAT